MTISTTLLRLFPGIDRRCGADGLRADTPLLREPQISTYGIDHDDGPNNLTATTLGTDAPSTSGSSFCPLLRPIAYANPYAYDDAGVAFPGDLAAVIQEVRRWRTWVAIPVSSSQAVAIATGLHTRGMVFRAGGCTAGAVVTLTVLRPSDWRPGSYPSGYGTTVATYTQTVAATGDRVLIPMDDIIAPDSVSIHATDTVGRAAYNLNRVSLYVLVEWTGATPYSQALSALLCYQIGATTIQSLGNRLGSCYGPDEWILPTTLPDGFTANAEPETERGRWLGHAVGAARVHRGGKINVPIANEGSFLPDATNFLLDAIRSGSGDEYRPPCVHGQAHIPSWPDESTCGLIRPVWPCIYVDDVLRRHPLVPYARGPLVTWTNVAGTGQLDPLGDPTVVGTPNFITQGPGWRNVRVWLAQTAASAAANAIDTVVVELVSVDDWSCNTAGHYEGGHPGVDAYYQLASEGTPSGTLGVDYSAAYYVPFCNGSGDVFVEGDNPHTTDDCGHETEDAWFIFAIPADPGTWVPDTADTVRGSGSISGGDLSSDATEPSIIDISVDYPPDSAPLGALYWRITTTSSAAGDGGEVLGVLAASPRCDLPALFSVYADGLTVPGGYKADLLEDPTNVVPCDHQAAGVTTATYAAAVSGHAYLASFAVDSDGLWDVVLTGSSDGGCFGEDEFHRLYVGGALARSGHRIYAWGKGTGSDLVFTLTARTPPSKAIASGGTTIAPSDVTVSGTIVSRWLFATLALPAAGSYDITVKLDAASVSFPRGVSLFGSAIDSLVLVPAGSARYSSDMYFQFSAVTATPPGSPSAGACYIVSASASGAWAGHDGEVAIWSAIDGAWLFLAPARGWAGTLVASAVIWWHDGTLWRTDADPVITIRVTVTAAQTYYLRLGPDNAAGEQGISFPTATISWAAA